MLIIYRVINLCVVRASERWYSLHREKKYASSSYVDLCVEYEKIGTSSIEIFFFVVPGLAVVVHAVRLRDLEVCPSFR